MQFTDLSPPKSPSLDQQRDALQKGLGRAVQWALSGQLADAPLLEACLHDKRYDQQLENMRGQWLWNIVQASGAKERFRDPIFQALNELSDESSVSQLCELARRYAEEEDEPFRSRLYEIVEQTPVADVPWLGEEEIIELDAEQAFTFAVRIRGKRLATIEWDWDDNALVAEAEERFGEEHIRSLLASSTDTDIKRFHDIWQEQTRENPTGDGSSVALDRMQTASAGEIIEASKSDDECFWFRGWGMHADEVNLKAIGDALWETDDPTAIGKLLRVFSNRAFPEFDSRLIDLCRHSDEDVQRWAFNALANNSDPAIRTFALEQLEVEATGPVVNLFVENFQDTDEQRILAAMTLPENPDQLHSLLLDVIKVLENHPQADRSQLGVIAYALTPCTFCRCSAARILQDQQVAPDWLREECQHDSDEECSNLFKPNSGSTLEESH